MKKNRAIPIIILIFSIACSGGKQIQLSESIPEHVYRGQATGNATIFANDVASAKDRAVNDAQNKLVLQILKETVAGRSLEQDFILVSNIIKAKSFELVKDYSIIKDWQERGVYFATIEGAVEVAVVEDAMDSILNTYGRPNFMVLIKETFEGKKNVPGFTEIEMIIQQQMENSGFRFVDSSTIQTLSNSNKSVMNNAINGIVNENDRNVLLNTIGAEVLIIGTVATHDQSTAMDLDDMRLKHAIVRLRAIDLYTGRVVAAANQNAPGMHTEDAAASRAAIANIIKHILGRHDPDTGKFVNGVFLLRIVNAFLKATNERKINLEITGLGLEDLTKFRNALLTKIRGVNSVVLRNRSGNITRFEVSFGGKTNDLANSLLADIGFNIKINESHPNRLVIHAEIKQAGDIMHEILLD